MKRLASRRKKKQAKKKNVKSLMQMNIVNAKSWNSLETVNFSVLSITNRMFRLWFDDNTMTICKKKNASNYRIDNSERVIEWNWTGELRLWRTCTSNNSVKLQSEIIDGVLCEMAKAKESTIIVIQNCLTSRYLRQWLFCCQ